MEAKISDLVGKTLKNIKVDEDKQYISFLTSDDKIYLMSHCQSCCEDVHINDICGDITDLSNTPILKAYETTNQDDDYCYAIWTFYHISTIKGSVTIRWFGSSNGYYSVDVDFDEVEKDSYNYDLYNDGLK